MNKSSEIPANFIIDKKLTIFRFTLYHYWKSPKKKRVSIFKIPVYSRIKSADTVIRRVLFIRWRKPLIPSKLATKKILDEILWSAIFQSTTANSSWLLDKTFSPGRWAVGYPFLYVMYRVLNDVKPSTILELGLGQSTRMTSQYAMHQEGVRHTVVEHDNNWITFFSQGFSIPACTNILQLNLAFVDYKNAQNVRVYQDFSQKIAGKKFDFIVIDGPLGGDMLQYARIDVLLSMPECLSENFVILIDDSMRPGEINTIREMEDCLNKNNITYRKKAYQGKKEFILLCAEYLGFLTSL